MQCVSVCVGGGELKRAKESIQEWNTRVFSAMLMSSFRARSRHLEIPNTTPTSKINKTASGC